MLLSEEPFMTFMTIFKNLNNYQRVVENLSLVILIDCAII